MEGRPCLKPVGVFGVQIESSFRLGL
jgi:hypothetical protein